MKCAIMQPTYIPWLGYFDLIDSVDKFVFLDDVQLVKRSWQVRNRIKTSQGELLLTVPIRKTKGRDELLIKEAVIDDTQLWRKKHLNSIYMAYKKSKFFCDVFSFLENLITDESDSLSDFNINIIFSISRAIGLSTEFIRSSAMRHLFGRKDSYLVSICKEIGCDKYISPQGSAAYIEKHSPGGEFVKNGIELFYHDYEHPVYDQLYGDFLPCMSVIDLFFNHGFEKSLEIIRSGRREPARSKIVGAVEKMLPSYCFDQYMFYPAADKTCWQKYLLNRLVDSFQDKESSFFFEVVDGFPFLVGCKIPRWDKEHFGFGMATINWVVCPDTGTSDTVMERLLGECISFLRDKEVKFVSAHISGDAIRGLHLLEDKGFRYYQTTVYPVARCTDLANEVDPNVRLWRESDLPAIIQVAKNNQFNRGHFYCDDRFDKKAVDSMYEKWIRTSWENKEPMAVIENDGDIVGYFAFLMDDELSKVLGYRYGRMRSLSIDSAARGKGLGSSLFRSVMSLIAGMGGQYIVSEYPLRNFVSARLHTKNLFYPVHEKVLLHFWL